MNALAPFRKFVFVLGPAVLAVSCHHDKERVVVVQPAAPAPQPQQVVIQHDNPPAPPANTIVVHEAPPPPRPEDIPSQPPAPDNVWAPGHWEYQNGNYVWVSGRWISRPQPSAEYIPPHWENRAEGWVYVQGRWR